MGKIDGLNYAKKRWHQPKYVLGGGRYGEDAGLYSKREDCSSFAYKYLKVSGCIPQNHPVGNTDTLFKDVYRFKWKEIHKIEDVKPGDIFITGGDKGRSLGAAGHTGIFLSNKEIIHCSPGPGRLYWTVITNTLDECKQYGIISGKTSWRERYFRPVELYKKEEEEKKAVFKRVADISEWQNIKNYKSFAEDIDAVIIRSSYTSKKDKKCYVDKKFEEHYKNFVELGVPIGIYHYSLAVNKKEAREEAEFVYSIIKNKKISLPVFIDIEDSVYHKNKEKVVIDTTARAFCKALEEKRFFAGIYTYGWMAQNKFYTDTPKKHTLWVAEYGVKNPSVYKGVFDAHQYTNKGRVKGYSGDVDISYVYKNYPKIIADTKLNNFQDIKNIAPSQAPKKKATTIVAREVIDGLWGNGEVRKKRLVEAGYSFDEVQKIVNQMLYKPVFYIVKKGDTLTKIAKKYNTTVENIRRLNKIKNIHFIRVGQRLQVK